MISSTQKNLRSKENQQSDLDPNVRQRRASNPDASVWVNASAGTGKTKVLTDRVLRLLLPRKNGQSGAKAHKIICLTFTKNAAAEMALRINRTLSAWVMMDQAALTETLKDLLGHPPTPQIINAARKLFVEVLDSPGGLNILTIHSFCQSILGRFPVEANLPPHFTVIEEYQSQFMLKNAINSVFFNNKHLHSIELLASEINENQFEGLLNQFVSESSQFKRILKPYSSTEDLSKAIHSEYKVDCNKTVQNLCDEFCEHQSQDLQNLCATLSKGTKSDIKIANAIQIWIESDREARKNYIPNYCKALLTTKYEPRKLSKSVLSGHPEVVHIYTREVVRILEFQDQCAAKKDSEFTFHLLSVARDILKAYKHEKTLAAVLDYEDLISMTLDLLSGSLSQTINTSWVLYKLDGGIDHMLIDESQDTNPEQWQILSHLCEDFYHSVPNKDSTRTLFVVGDEKQSIYSFQRAAPKEFSRMKAYFKEKITQSGHHWHEEDMTISFRSTKSVLQLVDHIFSADNKGAYLGADVFPHTSFRRGDAGHAEIWPLEETPLKEEQEPWTPPIEIRDHPNAQVVLAQKIAQKIRHWIDRKKSLPPKGRAITPGDILILVRTRTAFVNQLMRALKSQNIPVSGADRLILSEALAAQDLMIAGEFALLPDDDLALATLLKSPLCGLNDDDLFALCHGRQASLLFAIQNNDQYKNIAEYCEWLIRQARQVSPHQFFTDILYQPCPAHPYNGFQAFQARLGQDCLDPIEEFMNSVLNKEHECHSSLQALLHILKSSNTDIKRELDESGDMVRIMTVHGAKGLQAPIVFLPDTTRTSASKRINSILWPDKTGLKIPICSARKSSACRIYKTAYEKVEAELDEEYHRLLYVALTRAEDQIYICGYKGQRSPIDDSWYHHVEKEFDAHPHVQEHGKNGHRYFFNDQTRKIKNNSLVSDKKSAPYDPPQWLFENAPDEAEHQKAMSPSHMDDQSDDEPILSPRINHKNTQIKRFQRGNLTHMLLQILPDIPVEHWDDAAMRYLSQKNHNIETHIQKDIWRETKAVLTHPDFTSIFGEGSQAEVAISGILSDGTRINGQIDRLLITDDEILIVDYKTNRPPPLDVKDVSTQYRKQLAAYADIMAQIYPNRTVRTALLWTDGPRLMEISL